MADAKTRYFKFLGASKNMQHRKKEVPLTPGDEDNTRKIPLDPMMRPVEVKRFWNHEFPVGKPVPVTDQDLCARLARRTREFEEVQIPEPKAAAKPKTDAKTEPKAAASSPAK